VVGRCNKSGTFSYYTSEPIKKWGRTVDANVAGALPVWGAFRDCGSARKVVMTPK
jgi:hypothetical protein